MKPDVTRIVAYILYFYNLNYVFSCEVDNFNPYITNHKHIAAVILARGGSKGIKLKNLATINNKTLLATSLDAILKVPLFHKVWVSTDNTRIFQEADRINKKVNIHWRSEESASDTATSISALQEFLLMRPEVDIIALVQCTSPFIREEYLQKAVSLILSDKTDCVFSVTRTFKLRWTQTQNGNISPLNFHLHRRPRRQDWSGELVENGMFYLAKRDLVSNGFLQNHNCKSVEIPEEHGLEIDTDYHLKLAQFLHDYKRLSWKEILHED